MVISDVGLKTPQNVIVRDTEEKIGDQEGFVVWDKAHLERELLESIVDSQPEEPGSIQEKWIQVIEDKLPKNAKNLQDNYSLLIQTRKSRRGLGQNLRAGLEKFRYLEDRLQRQIKFSSLFGTVFAQ